MFTKRAILTIDAPKEKIFNYLISRYKSEAFIEASKLTKGYVPKVIQKECNEADSFEFSVRGRDPLSGIFIGGWKWGYKLTVLSELSTKVEIWYSYGLFMAFLGMGTIGHQAANEITETAMALDALTK